MPDRRQTGASAGSSVLVQAAGTKQVLPVTYPLDDFYARAGLTLPPIQTIAPEQMPQPYRSLLAHQNDMTPTLSAFHARIILLRVLGRQHRDDFYFREVVLLAEDKPEPVEFGAIRINLALFAPAARRHILDERVPLGQLLQVHGVPHSSRPRAFFRLEPDELIMEALQLAEPQVLYGRRNALLDSVNRPLADVVEILPPLRGPREGYLEVQDNLSSSPLPSPALPRRG